MYDTVYMKLCSYEIPGVSLLEEIPGYLDSVTGEHIFNGSPVLTGCLGSLGVSIEPGALRINRGSLCKWFLGDNVGKMSRGDTKRAIERLSDSLHLPMYRAIITRFDVAQNLIMKYPAAVYANHLGMLRNATRLQEPDCLYYKQGAGRLAFYDKTKEVMSHRSGEIPEICKSHNILRYERRFEHRLTHYLNEPDITASTLYDERFYIKVVDFWHNAYKDIEKINNISINTEAMRSKRQFDIAARLALVEKFGGEAAFLEILKEKQRQGEVTKKQAFDIRKAIKEACTSGESLTVKSDAIEELDRKIKEAAAYYR